MLGLEITETCRKAFATAFKEIAVQIMSFL